MSGALVLAIVGGLLMAAVGFLLFGWSRQRVDMPARPPQVEKTSRHGRELIIERWIFLALELSRADGAIHETEIGAIERSLCDPVIGMSPSEAADTVHKALRATIREASIVIAADEIAREADAEHRDFVLRSLGEIAAADGATNRDEKVFLQRVAQALGQAWPTTS